MPPPETASDVRVRAMEYRMKAVESKLADHMERCEDDKTFDLKQIAGDAKGVTRRAMGAVAGVLAVVFFSGGAWFSMRDRVEHVEEAVSVLSQRTSDVKSELSKLVREQDYISGNQLQIQSQLEEMVIADSENRKARVLTRGLK